MAYHEHLGTKIGKLVRNPRKQYKNIVPFLKSVVAPHKRRLYEAFGNESLSQPYPSHERLLKHFNQTNGFFVECGGNDGHFQDPTYYLEKFRKWSGVIVEALPIARKCAKNRGRSIVYETALVPFGSKESSVSFIDVNAMSFIKGSIEKPQDWIHGGETSQKISMREIIVPAKPLQEVLDDYFSHHEKRDIDLLAIDVEGSELSVLQGLDFKKIHPLRFSQKRIPTSVSKLSLHSLPRAATSSLKRSSIAIFCSEGSSK